MPAKQPARRSAQPRAAAPEVASEPELEAAPEPESAPEAEAAPEPGSASTDEPAEEAPLNRAERRAKGKGRPQPGVSARGKVAGSHGPVSSPRMWANRRSG